MSDDKFTKGYIETGASTRRRSKEDIRVQELIPSQILQDASDDGPTSRGIETLLDAYYRFMNLDEFTFLQDETYTALVLDDNTANFRISDPELNNDKFFSQSQVDEQTIIDQNGSVVVSTLMVWSNGNNIPKLLEDGFNKGKSLTLYGISSSLVGKIITLTTQTINYRKEGPSSVLNTINDALNIDKADEDFLDMMQKEIAAHIPKNLTANKRNLYKKIIEYYKIRGSSDSVQTFFRLLYNDEVEVEYPYESTLIPSSGNYDESQDLYLDTKGFLSDNIKLHDSYFYQKFSYVIKTGRNIEEWEDIFTRLVHPAGFIFFGEILIVTQLVRSILGDNIRDDNGLYPRTNRLTLSSMPGTQPGLIGIEDLALIIELLAPTFGRAITAKNTPSNTVGAINPVDLSVTMTIGNIAIDDGGAGLTAVGSIDSRSEDFLTDTYPAIQGVTSVSTKPIDTSWGATNIVNGYFSGFIYYPYSDVAQIIIADTLLDTNSKYDNETYVAPDVPKLGFDYLSISVNGVETIITTNELTKSIKPYVTYIHNSTDTIFEIDTLNPQESLVAYPGISNDVILELAVGALPTISSGDTVVIKVGGYGEFSKNTAKYRANPHYRVSAPLQGGQQATIRTIMAAASIAQIDVKVPGGPRATYSTPPVVTIGGPQVGTNGAIATSVLDSNGHVTGITLESGGAGYQELPTVSIAGETDITFTPFFVPTSVEYAYFDNSGTEYYSEPNIRRLTSYRDEVLAYGDSVVKTFVHGSNIDYHNRKGDSIRNRPYNMNIPIHQIGDILIENFGSDDINNINTNTFITI